MTDSDAVKDPKFQMAVERLHRLTVLMRWAVVLALWLTLGVFSLWRLSYPISLLQQYFTWAAVRHGLMNDFIAAIGLSTCIGITVAVLVWQSRNILFGRSRADQARLEQTVFKVRRQGKSHPLWKWID
jgi:hypothetical protein